MFNVFLAFSIHVCATLPTGPPKQDIATLQWMCRVIGNNYSYAYVIPSLSISNEDQAIEKHEQPLCWL